MVVLWHDSSRTHCDEVYEERTGKADQGKQSAQGHEQLFPHDDLVRGDEVQAQGVSSASSMLLLGITTFEGLPNPAQNQACASSPSQPMSAVWGSSFPLLVGLV